MPALPRDCFTDVAVNGCASAHGSSATCFKRTHSVPVVGRGSSLASGIPQKSPWSAERISSSASSDGVRCP